MGNLNINGFDLLQKPKGYSPKPSISHSIIPSERDSFNLWGESIRCKINGSPDENVILVKKSPLYVNPHVL